MDYRGKSPRDYNKRKRDYQDDHRNGGRNYAKPDKMVCSLYLFQAFLIFQKQCSDLSSNTTYVESICP